MIIKWRDFQNEQERDSYLAHELNGLWLSDPQHYPKFGDNRVVGGRTAALQKLNEFTPHDYGQSRNFLNAPVSQLSPYLRHGFLHLNEVRVYLQQHFTETVTILEEFLRQLSWRDFFLWVLDYYGDAIHDNLETPKHRVPRSRAAPEDLLEGNTGLPCVDSWFASLRENGYLHNHERLWFAAYWCHFRGIDWTLGARLFRQYLLDGDIASNSCSWQWVESTFASKPYFMNQENIAKYSHNRWCSNCLADCPFRESYDQLQETLFLGGVAPFATKNASSKNAESNK